MAASRDRQESESYNICSQLIEVLLPLPRYTGGKSGSSCSLGAALGRLGYGVGTTDSAAPSVVASRIFFGIGNSFSIAR